jgi:hypothetical protein
MAASAPQTCHTSSVIFTHSLRSLPTDPSYKISPGDLDWGGIFFQKTLPGTCKQAVGIDFKGPLEMEDDDKSMGKPNWHGVKLPRARAYRY